MGCGLSLCCKPTGTSMLESSRSRFFKPSAVSIASSGNGHRDQLNEEGVDDFEKELEQLNDEVRGEDMSPPPTLDESMSDNDTSLTKIAAVVTSKIWESPLSAIFTSTSRTDQNGAPEIDHSSENTEEAINSSTNETLQEDAFVLKLDASSDSFVEALDEKVSSVDVQSVGNDHFGEPETTLLATEEISNVAHVQQDFDEIKETVQLEPLQVEAIRSEKDFLRKTTEEEKEITAEMTDIVESPTPEAEGKISINEELLDSSPQEDLSEAKETMVDCTENTEIVIDQVEELENAAEPTDLVENDDDRPDVDIPMDVNEMEETVDLELRETVNESDAIENELQEIFDEELPQGIGGNISEINKIEDDISHENAEEEEQTFDKTVDVVDSSTPQAEEEPSEHMEIFEKEADSVEDPEILPNQLRESDNVATSPTGLTEHGDEEQQREGSIVIMDILLPSSIYISDSEEACPVEMAESNQLDIEETGSISVEDELNVAQEHDQEVKPFESSYVEEQIQVEDLAIQDGEHEEENYNKIMDTQNKNSDDDKKEMDETQNSVSEAEGFEVADIIVEQPSEVKNIEENLAEVGYGDITKDFDAYEVHDDGDLQQNASLIEDKSPPIPANEDSFLEVEDTEPNSYQASEVNVLPEENMDQDDMFGNLMEIEGQQADGFSQDVEINVNDAGDANETAHDAENLVHSSCDEHYEESTEKLGQNDESPSSLLAESDGKDNQFPNSDLESATTALDRTLEVEDTGDVINNSSIIAPQKNEHTPDIDVEEEGKISTDTEMGESEISNLISGIAYDESPLQEDTRSMYLNDTPAEDGSGLNALSFTENVVESESGVNEGVEAEPNDTATYNSHPNAEENHDLQSELDDTQHNPDLKSNAPLDEDFNELLYEGDKEVSNDDEEEIWIKLQKDLQLEEEEQQTLAAIKIQSTFRGYKCRKEFNHTLENKNQDEDDNNHIVDDVENVPEDQVSMRTHALEEPLESNDNAHGLTGALAGVTESEDQRDEELDGNLVNENATDTSHAFSANQREVNDVTEEPMSNGEEIRNIQLIESYVITSSIADSSTSLESQEVVNVENSVENGSHKVNDDSASEKGITEAEAVNSDPGVVFELYVESNETTNDGLLESYCLQREDPAMAVHLGNMDSLQDGSITVWSANENELDSCLLESENLAATKIQASFRGHQGRKKVRDFKNDVAENASSTRNEIDNTKVLERENAAATTIQAGFRGHQDRKRIKDAKHCASQIGGTDQNNFTITEEKWHLNDGDSSHQLQPIPCSLEQENAAATKIQAGYRGHQDRKRIRNLQHRINENTVVESDKAQRMETISPADQPNIERDSQYVCLEELENAAATKIQASFRGYQDRKNIRHSKYHAIPNDSMNEQETNFAENKGLFYCDDSIPRMDQNSLEEESAAATKIQAGFRGHQDRKRVKCLKDSVIKQDDVIGGATSYKEEVALLDYDQCAESMQVDLENTAATKIQAGFRGHQDRKRVKNLQRHKSERDFPMEREMCVDAISIAGRLNEELSQENELENAAATKIQASFRGHQDRKKTKHLKNQATPNDLINEKEAIFVDENCLLDFDELTRCIRHKSFEEENAAATKIQAGFRGHQDRKRVKGLKDSVVKSDIADSGAASGDEEAFLLDYDQSADSIQVHLENNAATKIQAGFRGHQDRKRVKNLQRPITDSDIRKYEEEFTDPIPAHAQSNVEQSQENLCLNDLENAAATKIQAGFRGHQDRKKTKHLKNRAIPNELINEKEAIFVDENCLLDLDENTRDTRRNSLEEENAAATKIQAGFRGHQDRKRVKFLKEEITLLDYDQSAKSIQVDLENTAATKIQAGFRGHQDRKRVKNLQRRTTESYMENDNKMCTDTIPALDQSNVEQSQENLCMDELENAAATKIQAGFRGYQERKNVKQLKNQTASSELMNEKETNTLVDENCFFNGGELIQHIGRNSLEEENFAAIKIQAGFRGHQDRKRVKYLKDSMVKSTDVIDNGCARHNESPPLENDQDAEAIQVDLENTAATKIQASFRGHQGRKRLKN